MANRTTYTTEILFGLEGVVPVEFTVNALPHDLDRIEHWLLATLSKQGGLRVSGVTARIVLPPQSSALHAYVYDPTKTRPIGLVEIKKKEQ